MASIYEPCLLLGKIIYRNLHDLKVSLDKELPVDIETQMDCRPSNRNKNTWIYPH